MIAIKLHPKVAPIFEEELKKHDVDYTVNENEFTIPAADPYTWNLSRIYHKIVEEINYGVRKSSEEKIQD